MFHWKWIKGYPKWLEMIGSALVDFGRDTGFIDKEGTPVRVGDLMGLVADPYANEKVIYFVYFDPDRAQYIGRTFFQCELTHCYDREELLWEIPDFTKHVVIGDLLVTPEKFKLVRSLTPQQKYREAIRASEAVAKAIKAASDLAAGRFKEAVNPS